MMLTMRRAELRFARALALLVLGLVSGRSPLPAQEGEPEWNSARARELVERARDRRRMPVADSSLRNYRADVAGHIYFFIDREDDPEPVLLRADQVALELYWAQPGRAKQVIQGMRSEEQFPIRDFRYYLDRYTVIQNGFDDVIRVGEGRDVRNVIHPLARQADFIYDFRLADSLTIQLPAEPEPIRVYEIEVRPKLDDTPAIVGSLFVERARGDLVRLAFTFTPAAYVDPRNERVEVMLENALWDGRYWLPRQQRLLVRREIPQLDLDVGTVIRAALTVRDYELNTDLPADFFSGRDVMAVAGPEGLAEYEFEEGLFDGLDDVGLAPGSDPGTLDAVDIDAIAGRILRERYLRGISRVRLFLPTASGALRYDRTEGAVIGLGTSIGVGRGEIYGYGGYAWGSREPVAELGWQPAGRRRGVSLFASGYLNRPRELGLRPGAAGVISSLAAAWLGQDFRDVAIVSGGEAGVRWGDGRTGQLDVAVAAEDLRPLEQAASVAPWDETAGFRPVPPLADVSQIVGRVGYRRRLALGPVAMELSPAVEVGAVRDDRIMAPDPADSLDVAGGWRIPVPPTGFYARVRLDGQANWSDPRYRGGLQARLTAAAVIGDRNLHHLWYLGGRNTLPGHPFHGYVGDRVVVVDVEGWRTVVPRLLRLRGIAAAGWTGLDGDPPPGLVPAGLEPWAPTPTDGPVGSLGLGLGLVDGILRLDYAVRTDTWDGSLILSVDPRFWSFL
jgi:hypothetical protein